MSRRIGILGGTFDPIHVGHLIIGQEILVQCALDQILFMPSGEPPHKHNPEMASAEDRAHMVGLAIQDHPHFALSRFELQRPGKSYTVDTLRDFRQQMLEAAELFLIIGADNAVEMGDWCRPEDVLELAQVLVAERPGFPRERIADVYRKKMQFVETPLLDIASTTIRQRVRRGLPIRFFVPDAVIRYIEAQALYC